MPGTGDLPPLTRELLALVERLIREFDETLPAGAVIRAVAAVRARTRAAIETPMELLASVEREARDVLSQLSATVGGGIRDHRRSGATSKAPGRG